MDRFWSWTSAAPSATSNPKVISGKAFWPTTLDKECDKAARILRSFCKDGFVDQESPLPNLDAFDLGRSTPESETGEPGGRRLSHRVSYKRIPSSVIQSAKALVIFTTMRTGLWVSGAGGSGVIVARLPDGTWSPPSAIMLHTEGVGFLVGVDLYDCIMVINTRAALTSFYRARCTIGPEAGAVIGPLGTAGILQEDVVQVDFNVPIFTYLKSRGSFARVQLEGTVVEEREDENDRFYGRRISVAEILAGRVSKLPFETNRLLHTIKAAQGDSDVDPSMVPVESSPSDVDLATGKTFGVPNKHDPDPYGFLALEKEGLLVREAGTLRHASRESFQFLPAPSSPLFNSFNRDSMDMVASRRSSWRTTVTEKSSRSADMAGQTDEPPLSPMRPPSALQSVMNITDVDSDDNAQDESTRHYLNTSDPGMPQWYEAARADSLVPQSDQDSIPSLSKRLESNGRELFNLPEELSPPPKRPDNLSIYPLADPSQIDQDAELNLPTPTPPPQLEAAQPDYLPTPTTSLPLEAAQPDYLPAPTTPVLAETVLDAPSSPPILLEPLQSELSDADDEDDYDSEDDEIVEFHHGVIQAASPQPIIKARLVTVSKPPPPILPTRNPNRLTRTSAPSTAVETNKDPSWPEEHPRSSSRNSSIYSLGPKDMPTSIEPSLGSASSTDPMYSTHASLHEALKGTAHFPDFDEVHIPRDTASEAVEDGSKAVFNLSHPPVLTINGELAKTTSH
jgi:lipid-binding SYLF domain-containing protein